MVGVTYEQRLSSSCCHLLFNVRVGVVRIVYHSVEMHNDAGSLSCCEGGGWVHSQQLEGLCSIQCAALIYVM